MSRAKAEVAEEIPGAVLEGRDRKSREHNNGASGVTVMREAYWAEAETRLMEEIVSRANMQKAYNRVVSNKGAAGVDNMSTGALLVLFLFSSHSNIMAQLYQHIYQHMHCFVHTKNVRYLFCQSASKREELNRQHVFLLFYRATYIVAMIIKRNIFDGSFGLK